MKITVAEIEQMLKDNNIEYKKEIDMHDAECFFLRGGGCIDVKYIWIKNAPEHRPIPTNRMTLACLFFQFKDNEPFIF